MRNMPREYTTTKNYVTGASARLTSTDDTTSDFIYQHHVPGSRLLSLPIGTSHIFHEGKGGVLVRYRKKLDEFVESF